MLHGSRTGLTLAIALVLSAADASAATYYFSTSGNNTSGSGTQASPFYSLCGPWQGAPCTTGISKISSGQIPINPGDTLLFERGDEWKGLDAQWSINTTGAVGNPVTFGAYGDSALARPVFTGSKTAYELGLDVWTNVAGTSIWYTTVTWKPWVASQEDSAVDGPHLFGAFSVQGVTNANGWNSDQSMVRGTHFYDEGTKRLYVWRTDNLKPDHTKGREIYIGMEIWDGSSRLVKVDRGWGGPAGSYFVFEDLHVRRSPAYGFSTSYANTEYRNCLAELNGMEGFLFDRRRFGAPLPGAKNGVLRNCVARRNNMSQGSGIGQGITIEAENVWAYDTESYENAWAGFDFLDYETTTKTDGGGLVNCKAHHNGISPLAEAAFDPNIYIDGGSNITIKNCQVWAAGVDPRGEKTRKRSNPGISIDVEAWGYSNGKRPTGNKVINTLSYGNMGEAIRVGAINGGQSVKALSNIQIIGSTLHRDRGDNDIPGYYNASDPDKGIRTVGIWNVSTGLVFRNNILTALNTARAPLFGDIASIQAGRAVADFDYNIYNCPGCNFSTNGSWDTGGFFSYNYIQNWTVDQWRNAGGTSTQQRDTALSKTIMTSDPLLANTSMAAFDSRLQFSSPAFDRAFTSIFPTDLSGTTRADNLPDVPYNDIGFHYPLAGSTPPPVLDTTAPSVPAGVTASASSATQVLVSWSASTDNVGVVGYKVFRDGTQIATVTTTSRIDTSVSAQTAYNYTVQSTDAAGNSSSSSASVSVTTPAPVADTTAPSVPVLSSPTVSGGTVTLQWSASTDNVAVTGYQIFRGSNMIATAVGTTATDSGVNPGLTYSYTVRATDAAGNTSAASQVLSVTIPDLPTDSDAPSGLTGNYVLADRRVNLGWTAPVTFPVYGYNIYRNGVEISSVGLTFGSDSSVAAGLTYTYTVCAYTVDGTLSSLSDPFTITVPGSIVDTQAPSAPTGLAGVVSGAPNLQVLLSWNDSTDNVGVTEYRVFLAGLQVASVPSPSYVHTGLLPLTSYVFTVKAVDAVGNLSAASNTLALTTPSAPDTELPTTPTGLTAVPSAGQAALEWSASTDNVGVTGYQVFRGTTLIGATTLTSYTATGLAVGTYSFTVKAVDAAGNVSNASVAADAVIIATVPGVPTNVTSVLFTKSVQVTWTKPTSGAPITGYNLFRNGVYFGSFSTTTASDPTVVNGNTYTYTVAAFTATGAVSAKSLPTTINVFFKPAFLSVSRSGVTQTTALVKWTLNVPASGYVMWGTSPGYINNKSYEVPADGTSYTLLLNNLPTSRDIYFRVVATNAGGETTSARREFRTKAA